MSLEPPPGWRCSFQPVSPPTAQRIQSEGPRVGQGVPEGPAAGHQRGYSPWWGQADAAAAPGLHLAHRKAPPPGGGWSMVQGQDTAPPPTSHRGLRVGELGEGRRGKLPRSPCCGSRCLCSNLPRILPAAPKRSNWSTSPSNPRQLGIRATLLTW